MILDARSTVPGDIKMAGVDESAAADTAHGGSAEKRATLKTKQEWIKNPAVRKTLEMFNGDVVDVRE